MAAPPTGDEEDADDWKFSVEDVSPEEKPDPQEEQNTESDGNIAGTLERNQPLEPGDIDLENAVFVVLGVLIVVILITGAILGI
ncbi:DUF7312 domain-containing protein [Halovenus sp. HT40]|uniref:DUF7312 domain-containing protein n=1 Tax=Halovenus sp. HT40 TaxID=3126691 RepID=UPI00300EACEE